MGYGAGDTDAIKPNKAENSISIMLSQEAFLGVKKNSKRCAKPRAAAGSKVSYSAVMSWVLRLSCTKGILMAWG